MDKKNKDRNLISFSKNNEYPGAQGDQDEEKYLVPGFDSETMDLDEEENNSDNVDDGKIERSICNRTQMSERCTVMGINSLGKKVSMLVFSVEAVLHRGGPARLIAEKHNISFKIHKTECKLVRTIFSSHGLRECGPVNNDYNLLWTGCHVRPFTLRTMAEFQKINHFPRSYELTRKDRLFKNVQRMQQIKGVKNFDFLPPSYLIPSEFQDMCHNFSKDKGPYIVKPVALSRGRGIFLCNHPNQIPLDEQLIVSKYISNPYLIDGLKFDMRMYVLVTSYDPLVVYLYEEGLTRFATVKYHNGLKNLRTQCMHLTNYSVNKKNDSFVQNDDANIEDFGNKWSLGALLRYLKAKDVDTTCLMMKIEDIIIKSLIAVESQISASCRMFQPYRGNCFELYGYDIIIDENLRPWLLEVNLSPSLSCDSPLDFKIKSHMLSDMFNVIGVACQDPVQRNTSTNNNSRISKSAIRRTSPTPNQRPSTQTNMYNSTTRRPTAGLRRKDTASTGAPYKNDELRLVRRVKEENQRCGGWVRIFPTAETINTYMPFFQSFISEQSNVNAFTTSQVNLNLFLHSKLYPDSHNDLSNSNGRLSNNNAVARSRLSLHNVNYNAAFHKATLSQILPSGQSYYEKISNNYSATQTRVPFYERKLGEELTTKGSRSKEPKTTESNKFVLTSDEDGSSSDSSTSMSEKEDDGNHSDLDAETEEEESNNLQSSLSHSSKDTTSLEKLIDCGGKLTKIQARLAFSSYLARVQYRLLLESRTEIAAPTLDEETSRHEQLELVLRFLTRAASNMCSDEFTVPPVPDRSVSLRCRQEWLATLLGDFVRIYSRETRSAESKQHPITAEVDNKTFLNFLRLASENDLEQTLSNYTKVTKSAGIFLNPNLPQKPLPRPQESTPAYPPVGFHRSVSMTNLATKERPLRPPTKEPVVASPPKEHRPTSANGSPWRPGSTKIGGGARPLTSSHTSASSTQGRARDQSRRERCYDPDAISKALQRLAADHRSRQLTASVSSLCDSEVDDSQSLKRNTDPLTQTLIRQYQQSRKLLQESRAKHDAILSQGHADGVPPQPRAVVTNKPPPGIRAGQQTRLTCTLRK